MVLVFPNRFSTPLEECEHITLGLLISDVYEEQKQELINNYGSDVVEKAYENIVNNYSSLLARF